MANSKFECEVPSLKSRLVGTENAGIVSFRGIPYATLTKRWTHSKILDQLPSPYDATHYGPRAPAPSRESMWPEAQPADEPTPEMDEFRCLNLNITTPSQMIGHKVSTGSGLIPVMVWIHGGAFYFGSNSTARQETQRLCRLATEKGQPVVIVSINYRLGPLGYASSQDLATELSASQWQGLPASDPDYSSILGSYGTIDQRNALQWVQDHIRDFGGDPDRVTVFGTSAGSASIHFQILTGDPLFDRAIMQSGSAGTLGPLPTSEYEKAWDVLLKNGMVEGATPAERLARLRDIPADELVLLYPRRSAIGPAGDGRLLPRSWTHKEPQPQTRCKAIMIGDNRVEAIIMNNLIERANPASFRSLVRDWFAPTEALQFLENFGFADDISLAQFHDALRWFLSIVMFQFPALALARTYPGDTYYYHQEEPSPYQGPSYGQAAHSLCAMFLFRNYYETQPATARAISDIMGHLWIGFAYGEKPWVEYEETQKFMRLGPQGKAALTDHWLDDTRTYQYLNWLDANYDRVMDFCRHIITAGNW